VLLSALVQGTGYASDDVMKKTIIATVVGIGWCTAAPFAQLNEVPPSARQAEPAHKVYRLTGCLMTASTAAPTFKLTDAWAIGQAAPAQAGVPGAVGTSGQKSSYELRPVSGVGAQGLDAEALKAHTGHRVEVVVRPIEVPAPEPPRALTSSQTTRAIEPAPERYTVTEIKRVVGRCS
jgi:hypothetical protein